MKGSVLDTFLWKIVSECNDNISVDFLEAQANILEEEIEIICYHPKIEQ